ncbi:hypothetical protein HK405_015804, partial [Cladochytrium tenue]
MSAKPPHLHYTPPPPLSPPHVAVGGLALSSPSSSASSSSFKPTSFLFPSQSSSASPFLGSGVRSPGAPLLRRFLVCLPGRRLDARSVAVLGLLVLLSLFVLSRHAGDSIANDREDRQYDNGVLFNFDLPSSPTVNGEDAEYQAKWIAAMRAARPYNAREIGIEPGTRGIVFTGGESMIRHFMVSIEFLRDVGCQLPIQFVHVKGQVSDGTLNKIRSKNISIVDINDRVKDFDWGSQEWQWGAAKISAIMYSTFEEVLFMDPDNLALRDPTFLFESNRYKKYGAIFWPDFMLRKKDSAMWNLFAIPANQRGKDELEFESGQLVVDKRRVWGALQIGEFIASEGKFFFKHFLGDKESLHWGFRATRTPYYLVPYYLASVGVASGSRGNWDATLRDAGDGRGELAPGAEFCGLSMMQHDFYDGADEPESAPSGGHGDPRAPEATHAAATYVPRGLFMHGNGVKYLYLRPAHSMPTLHPFQV